MARRKTKEEFIADAVSVHGDKYDYSLVDYKNTNTKVTIRCIQCDYTFEQQPNNHVHSKRGCHLCAMERTLSHTRKNLEYYLPKLKDIHGTKYDFSLFTYSNHNGKSRVLCDCGEIFEMSIDKLLRGQGCKNCSHGGFKPNKPCFLYIMRVGDSAIKCGISINPEDRQDRLNRRSDKDILVLYRFHFETSTKAKELEDIIKTNFTGSFLSKSEVNDGYTETFDKEDIGSILKVCLRFCDNNMGTMSTGKSF